jgi:MEDS: MEthanogen/methylotroph, DcmR Sensory domain
MDASFHTDRGHFVQFFTDDARLQNAVCRYVRRSIESSSTCLVIGTAEHRRAIHESLTLDGFDVDALVSQYQYISLDAERMLSSFMFDGQPQKERFHRIMGLLIHQAASRGQPVRIFGEMVALLASRAQASAAFKLEELWNELSRQHEFTLFCAYRLSDIAYDHDSRHRICSSHSHELPQDACAPLA